MIRILQRFGQAVMAVLFLTSITSAGPIGYSVRSAANDHLLRIDMATGVATDLGAINFGDAQGISFGRDGNLYALGGFNEELWNITTPPGVKIGNTTTSTGNHAGLGLDPSTNVMYEVKGAFGIPQSWLYTVDTSTAGTTLVGTDFQFADNIAIASNGVAYAIDGRRTNSLYQVNLTTGAFTLVGNLVIDIESNLGSSFDPSTGILWAIDYSGQIFTVNTSTGAASFVSNVTLNGARVNGFEGLAVVPEPSSLILTLSGVVVGLVVRHCRRSV